MPWQLSTCASRQPQILMWTPKPILHEKRQETIRSQPRICVRTHVHALVVHPHIRMPTRTQACVQTCAHTACERACQKPPHSCLMLDKGWVLWCLRARCHSGLAKSSCALKKKQISAITEIRVQMCLFEARLHGFALTDLFNISAWLCR